MKKYIAILTVIILIGSMCALCACNGKIDNCQEPTLVTMYVPDGAPALSVANIINNKSVGNTTVNTVVTTGEEVVAKCGSGEADVAVLPTNAAVKVCSKRSDYQLFSVNVYGVLYVVGTEQIGSIADLQSETLYSIGLANTPEYVFKKICDTMGVKYEGENSINIQYQTDASSIIPQILQGKAKFALIGEPAVTQLINNAQNKGITVYNLFDLQQLWQQATHSDVKGYPQASLIVKKDLLTDSFANNLMTALTQNSEFLTNNCSKLNDIMQGAGSTLSIAYTADLIERCNLTAISAQNAKADIAKYLSTFGMTVPDSIYYETK